ncbi:hypothetical protein KP77_24870 [Jeotgalibacillus alimentarius]|uniref:Uncharacterized protein n=1 Tax=Jeotgalibacillus alimentarius TaxID=135826 RepID=A0A0C2RYP6_9BACL|nr:hypothetical protein [Jeotgalibacillus alimentarius]KIL46919.1 hypothetical protein KP77_24870 [Jeotgalibacillus alimentarius]
MLLKKSGGKDMKARMENYMDVLAFYQSGLLIMTGVFFIVNADRVVMETEVYQSMSQLAPFEFYGIAFCLAGVLLFIGMISEGPGQHFYYCLGSLLASILMVIYAAAGFENTKSSITSYRYLYIAGWFIAMFSLGVLTWRLKMREHKKSKEIM